MEGNFVFFSCCRNKRRNSQKSPSTWRTLFASKNRKQTWSRAPLDLENPLASLDRAATDHTEKNQSNGLASVSGSVGAAGGSRRHRLRLAQSVESLHHHPRHSSSAGTTTSGILQSRPLTEFGRSLNQSESPSLRTPVQLRRSQNAAHNRSLSHDSYFDEIVEMATTESAAAGVVVSNGGGGGSKPATVVIDVVQTIPCSMTESGVLVKLSLDETIMEDDGATQNALNRHDTVGHLK